MSRTHLLSLICLACWTIAGCETKNDDNKGIKPAKPQSATSTTTETKPAETKPAETKPAETKPAETKPAETKPAETKPANAGTGCAKLFSTATGTLGMDKVGCIERTMEGRGHSFDSKSCNALENGWPIGMGDFAKLWAACQQEQRFDDRACTAVLGKCF